MNLYECVDIYILLALNTFRKIQNKYPLGVCLTKDIYKEFHNIYGYGNNTKEQWDKFCLEYNKNVA